MPVPNAVAIPNRSRRVSGGPTKVIQTRPMTTSAVPMSTSASSGERGSTIEASATSATPVPRDSG